MNNKKLMVIGLAALFLLTSVTFAQKKRNENANTRSVQGIVMDASSNPVNQAVVQLKDTKTLQIRSFITHADGAYHFAGLGTNTEYELRAEKGLSSSSSRTLSVYDSRKTAVIDLKLK